MKIVCLSAPKLFIAFAPAKNNDFAHVGWANEAGSDEKWAFEKGRNGDNARTLFGCITSRSPLSTYTLCLTVRCVAAC